MKLKKKYNLEELMTVGKVKSKKTLRKIVNRIEDSRLIEIIEYKDRFVVDSDRVTIELAVEKSPKFSLSIFKGKKYNIASKIYIELYAEGIIVINNLEANNRTYYDDDKLGYVLNYLKIYTGLRGLKLNKKNIKLLEKKAEKICQ